MNRSIPRRMDGGAMAAAAILANLVVACGAGLAAPAPSPNEICVDQVAVRKGPRLLGAVLGRRADGTLVVAVSRAWLRGAHPRFFERALADERERSAKALRQARDRIDDWLARRSAEGRLSSFLNDERERLAKRTAEPDVAAGAEPAQFLLLELAATDVEWVRLAPVDRRLVALIAWDENLANVETRSLASLQGELRKNGVNPTVEPVGLGERLPPLVQDDDEWGARLALVEYQYLKTVDFQGSGDAVFRTGDDAPGPNMAAILVGVFRSQLLGQIAELLEEPGTAPRAAKPSEKWLESAVRQARAESVAGFRVTRVTPDLTARRVEVETRFVARLSSGDWKTIWRHVETADASKPDKDLEDQLANDPRIGEALKLVQALAPGAGEDPVRQALRFGAATTQAQRAADARFYKFRDRYLRRLEGPPLIGWNEP
ncbi:MAG: hypothetical protein ACT4QC_06645 [Planctomycetaceae bacterium]